MKIIVEHFRRLVDLCDVIVNNSRVFFSDQCDNELSLNRAVNKSLVNIHIYDYLTSGKNGAKNHDN